MLHLFKVRSDYASAENGILDGMNKWGLPGVTCPRCGETWGTVGRNPAAL